MNKATLITIILALVVWFGCGGKSTSNPTEISFVKDFETAKTEAIKANKPMIIDFYTDWCKYCKMLDTLTYVDSLVIAMSSDYVFVKINAEVDSTLAQKFMITGYPTIVITKPDGQEIDRIWGYMGPTEFYNQVQLFLQGKETLDDYLTRIADEPDNPEYLMIIGQKYASRGETHKAIEFYSRLAQLDGDNRRGYHAKALAAISDAQSRSKDYKSAIETSKEIISRFPTAPEADDAAAMLGYYTAQTGDEAGALALYREYLNKYPNGQRDWVQKRIADLEEKSKP